MVSDEATKYVQVVDEVYANLCGYERIIINMLRYVMNKFNKLIHDKRVRRINFDLICDLACYYFQTFYRLEEKHNIVLHIR